MSHRAPFADSLHLSITPPPPPPSSSFPGTAAAARRQRIGARHRRGLCRPHLHGPAGSDHRGGGPGRPGQLGGERGGGGPLGLHRVAARLHLHRPLHQICGLILLCVKSFNGVVLINKDTLLCHEWNAFGFSFLLFIPTPTSPSISDQVTRLLYMLLNMLLSFDKGINFSHFYCLPMLNYSANCYKHSEPDGIGFVSLKNA